MAVAHFVRHAAKEIQMPVVLNLDGEHPKCRVPNDTWRIEIDSEGRADVEGYWDLSYQAVPLDWPQLAKLKQLTELTYSGADATVIDYLASRRCSVTNFTWHKSERATFDFSKSRSITDLGIELNRKSLKLNLPSTGRLETLRLLKPSTGCRATVTCPRRGDGLSLMLFAGAFIAIAGLNQLSELQLLDVNQVDLRHVARAYPQLKSLDIAGSPVTLRNEASLAKLTLLERLRIDECYSMDVAAFPDIEQLPKLESLEFDGLRGEDAKTLKLKYSSLGSLDIQGKRSAAWVAKNVKMATR